MAELVIDVADPDALAAASLIEAHLSFFHEHSPPTGTHVLDLDGLRGDGVTFFLGAVNGRTVTMGALCRLDDSHVEIKSMHTLAEVRGEGVGRRILAHLIGAAREQGYSRISLETGTTEAMAPARALYAGTGFVECGPFADYSGGPNSVCMTLEL
ncbi:MAG: GNAT family N-acetyltransferase [Actinomycetota bacterium]|jgi:putative acetyltransferase|nr:GNAT family N-acetyltransferase [Actinomycetota bacterium]